MPETRERSLYTLRAQDERWAASPDILAVAVWTWLVDIGWMQSRYLIRR
jgi:hypothetical protein